MSLNPLLDLNDLYLRYRDGALDRRQFVARAGALGLSAAALTRFFSLLPVQAAARMQEAISIDREAWRAALARAYPFTRDAGAEASGGRLAVGRLAANPVTTFNLLLANDTPTQSLLNLCQEYLLGVSPIDGQFIPALADFWEIADDGRTYTFHLNRDARWHDDRPFTANDVVFSFRAQAAEETGTQFQASFANAVESYRKIDSNTVEVVAREIFAPIVFLGNSLTAILPKHIWEDVPFDQWRGDPGSTGADPSRVIGTGPFRFDSLSSSGETIAFSRNETFHDDPPIVDSLIFRVLPDEQTALDLLDEGDLDIFERVSAGAFEKVSENDDLNLAVYDTYSFIWYGTNLDPAKTTLFQDLAVRRALLHALDRETMVRRITRGLGEVAHGTRPLLSFAYDAGAVSRRYDYDPERANQLLDNAGWSERGDDGVRVKEGQRFAFTMLYGEESAQIGLAAAALQSYWQAIGIEATPRAVSFSAELGPALTETFDFEVAVLGFTWDATGDQSPMFGTEYRGAGFNAVGYSNPDYDELADEANRETNAERRRDLLIEASNLVNDDLPIGILWFRRDAVVSAARVHNFAPNGHSALWSTPWVWVE